jgi:hypothetical protein
MDFNYLFYVIFKWATTHGFSTHQNGVKSECIKTPEDGRLWPKHVVLSVKWWKINCCIIDGLWIHRRLSVLLIRNTSSRFVSSISTSHIGVYNIARKAKVSSLVTMSFRNSSPSLWYRSKKSTNVEHIPCVMCAAVDIFEAHLGTKFMIA